MALAAALGAIGSAASSPLGASVLGGLTSVIGSSLMGGSGDDATKAAMRLEAARLRQLKPYIEAGKEALPQFQEGIGDIPTMEEAINFTRNDPSYDFLRERGQEAIEGSAFALGKGLSGDTAEAVTQFGQDFANTKLNEILNRALTLQGTKQNQLGTLLQGGLNAAGRQSALPQLAMQRGANEQAMIGGIGNALTSTLGNVALYQATKPPKPDASTGSLGGKVPNFNYGG